MQSYIYPSRFKADPNFKVLTRKGTTIGTIVMMKTPVRGSEDSILLVPLRLQDRWDLVAEELLGDPNLKWVIMRHNRISDPFTGPKAGDRLLIPTQDQVRYYQGLSD